MKIGVVGGGPVALYAAYRLVKDGHDVILFERAGGVAGNIRSWGFVRLFSQLDLNLPADVKETLLAEGHVLPEGNAFLTGSEFVAAVLEPLAKWLGATGKCQIRLGREVVAIGRGRLLKSDGIVAMGDHRRRAATFRVLSREPGGAGEAVDKGFDVVVDASGSYGTATANRVGIGGVPAPGEGAAEAAGLLRRVIPDIKGVDGALVAGKRVAVIGTGYSAITCLRNLCDLAAAGGPGAPSAVTWLTRTPQGKAPYSVLEGDPLPQRSELARFGNALASAAEAPFGATKFEYVPDMAVVAIEQPAAGGLRLGLELGEEGEQKKQLEADVLLSLTGFHPDKELWSELQVHLCYASDGPMKLAQSLLAAKAAAEGDPAAAGDCLKQAAPGPQTLQNPEPDFYVLGMKSYGRNSTFLMRVGYEQVELLTQQLRAGPA